MSGIKLLERIAAPWEAGAWPPRMAASCGAARRASWRRAEDITAIKLHGKICMEENFLAAANLALRLGLGRSWQHCNELGLQVSRSLLLLFCQKQVEEQNVTP